MTYTTDGERTPARAGAPLRVLVAHGDPAARLSIVDVLAGAGIAVIAQTGDGLAVERLCHRHRPDVVVLDVAMPRLDGLGALERIAGEGDDRAPVVMLSASRDHELAFRALRRGALGFLDADVDLAVLPRVVRDVAEGKAALSRSFTSHLVARLRALPEPGVGMRPVQSSLTPREWEVADLLSLGKGTDEMADTMVLTIETVRTHVKNMMRKLDVHSRAELVDEIEHLRSGRTGEQAGRLSRPAA